MAPTRWLTEAFDISERPVPAAPNMDRDVILSSGRGNRNKSAPTKKFYDFVLTMVCYCMLKDPNTKQTTVVGQCISNWACVGDVHFWETNGLGKYTHISLTETTIIQGRTRPYLVHKFTSWLSKPTQQAIMEPYRVLQEEPKAAATNTKTVAALVPAAAPASVSTATSRAVDPSVAPSPPPEKKRSAGDFPGLIWNIDPKCLESLVDELLDGFHTDDATGPGYSNTQKVQENLVTHGTDEAGSPIRRPRTERVSKNRDRSEEQLHQSKRHKPISKDGGEAIETTAVRGTTNPTSQQTTGNPETTTAFVDNSSKDVEQVQELKAALGEELLAGQGF